MPAASLLAQVVKAVDISCLVGGQCFPMWNTGAVLGLLLGMHPVVQCQQGIGC
jgi:hypothetical protein